MIPQDVQKKMHELCNAYAKERCESFADEAVKIHLDNLVPPELSDSNLDDFPFEIRKLLGRVIAISYAKGYADCYDKQDVRTLLF